MDEEKKRLRKLSENLHIWLSDKINIKDAFTEEDRETTNIGRITELYIKNRGSLEVKQWGSIEPADFANPYGAYGLSEGEAMELIAFSNAIWGYALALGVHDDPEWFQENLWNRIKEIHDKDLVKARDNAIQAMQKNKNEENKIDQIKKSPQDRQQEPESITGNDTGTTRNPTSTTNDDSTVQQKKEKTNPDELDK